MRLSMRTLPTMMSLRSGMAALDEEFALPRSVELVEEDALGVPEHELCVGDDQRQADADEHRLDVPGRILRRVELMLEVDAGRDQPVEVVVDILEALRIPEGGDRETGRGVRHEDGTQPFRDLAGRGGLADGGGDVVGAVGGSRERVPGNRHAPPAQIALFCTVLASAASSQRLSAPRPYSAPDSSAKCAARRA